MSESRRDASPSQGVIGERGSPLVRRVLSVHARYSHGMATLLMMTLGIGGLAWYYSHQVVRQRLLAQARRSAASAEAATEMPLPPLGAMIAPFRAAVRGIPSQVSVGHPSRLDIAPSVGVTPVQASAPTAGPIPSLLQEVPRAGVANVVGNRPGDSSSGLRRVDRRYQAEVYEGEKAPSSKADSSFEVRPMGGQSSVADSAAEPVRNPAGGAGTLQGSGGQLTAASATPIMAQRQQGRSMLLSKGTFIDCTLETAIDSSLPGITSCVTASDTYGADGRVVLLARGTRLFGETQGQVQQGSVRVSVLWSEARTPDGVVVPLASPGTDELGRSGLPGVVQRHFWQRFGAAILLTTIDGAVQGAVQASSSHDGGTVIYSPGATQDIMTEVLKNTVAIPPTIMKGNGERIEVLVARDVDFSGVYSIRALDGED